MIELMGVEIGFYTSILLIIVGFAVALAGKMLLKLVIGLSSGILLGYVVFRTMSLLNSEQIPKLVLSFLAFIVGFYLGWFILKLMLSIITGFLIGILVSYSLGFLDNIAFTSIATLLSIGIAYLISEKIISITCVLAGLAMIFLGLYALSMNIYIASIITILLLGIILALKKK